MLDQRTGLGRLRAHGVRAEQNITATPSVTAVSHIAIATGSTAAHNDVSGNSIHPVAATHRHQPQRIRRADRRLSNQPARPRLRADGRTAVGAAAQPGTEGRHGDLARRRRRGHTDLRDARAGAPRRPARPTTPCRSVRSEAWAHKGSRLARPASRWQTRRSSVSSRRRAASRSARCKSPRAPWRRCSVRRRRAATCGTTNASGRTLRYDIKVAALDTTQRRIDQLRHPGVLRRQRRHSPGPFTLPSTGPAYARLGRRSACFFYEGSGNKVGAAFFVSALAPDLTSVRFVRYSANFIPRNTPVIADVDDINEHVGFLGAAAGFPNSRAAQPGVREFQRSRNWKTSTGIRW